MKRSVFAVALRKAREDKGLTQRELASTMEMTQQAIGRWETGRGVPNVTSLAKLRGIFGPFDKGIDRRDDQLAVAPVVTPKSEHVLETPLGHFSFDYLSEKLAADIIEDPPQPRYPICAAALWKLSCAQIIAGGRRDYALIVISSERRGIRTERRVVLEASMHNLSVNFLESREKAMQLIEQLERENSE